MLERVVTFSRDFTVSCPITVVLPRAYEPERAWPLVMALHGMGESDEIMQRYLEPLLEHPWIWCFPRGPYAHEVRKPESRRLGYAWYLFDGDQPRLRESMDATATHLLAIHDRMRMQYPISASALVGFSQGGYLAGAIGPNHPQRFKAAGCIAGRLKWEFLDTAPPEAHQSVSIAQFHGALDENVSLVLATEAVERTRALGFKDVRLLTEPDAGHRPTRPIIRSVGQWLEEVFA